jgi:hypothetical protein
VQGVARDLFVPGRIALTVLGPLGAVPITCADLAC